MDIGSIMTNSGYIDLISNSILMPYQKRIICQMHTSKNKQAQRANHLRIDAAVEELQQRRANANEGSEQLNHRIDSLLLAKLDG